MKKSKKFVKNEDDCEEWCFFCKDGGDLIICDHRECLKSYHPDCTGLDETSAKAKKQFICALHKCINCDRAPDFQCYGCPRSVCKRESCIKSVNFVHIKGKKGFCENCLKLTLLVEEKKDVDSDGETEVDFNDRETYETLYKEYWEIINTTEKLTLDVLLSAKENLKSGKNYDSDKSEEEDYQLPDSDENEEMEPHDSGKKSKKAKPPKSSKKKVKANTKVKVKAEVKAKSNKEEFIGWGSRSLMNFLNCIGKDTTNALSQHELENIVKRYSKDKNLMEKNKVVMCDELLRSIFKRKTIKLNRIYDSLETHLAENQVSSSSDEDDFGYDSEEKHDFDEIDYSVIHKNKKKKTEDKIIEKKEVVNYRFASIVPENIRLVYLRRSLVQKFEKETETFESKVVGSFVRVKEDANGCYSKNSFKLMQITGVKKCIVSDNFMLQALEIDINISSLSEDDFSEEECQDLKNKVKSGMLKKLELIEVEEKARSLHRDIVTHWIPRELSLLKHRIDQANEKGWRKELFEYLKRREFLQSEKNQTELLEKVPTVFPDVEDDNKDSPKSILTNSSSEIFKDFGVTSEEAKQEVPASEEFEMAMKLQNFFEVLEKKEKFRRPSPSVIKNPSQLFDQKSTIDDISKEDVEDTGTSQWYITTSLGGDSVGPVSLSVLKNWSQTRSASESKIYKTGQTKEEAKPLTFVLGLAFPGK